MSGVTELHVHYPLQSGRIVLRTDADWEHNIEAKSVTANGSCYRFELQVDRPFLYLKPLIMDRDGIRWAKGDNHLVVSGATRRHEIYPYFFEDAGCSACEVHELIPNGSSIGYPFRIFHPPGYAENTLKRYPTLYMHDGQNLFFREEAFQGVHWRIPETLRILDAMNVIDEVIVVGIYPNERERDYTFPGYERYGKFLVEELKPQIDADFRTLSDPQFTATMGSSLGGVASFFVAWRWPETFGMAACMSSTFGWRDDLGHRVAAEPKKPVRFYLDSGWPRDNYEVTRNMRALLVARGYTEGTDLMYLAFPQALHNEQAWAIRAHIPFQFFFSKRPGAAPLQRE